MPYEPSKDKVHKVWTLKGAGFEGRDPILGVSIRSYGNGKRKLQLGPRFYRNKQDELREGKVGRISYTEACWLAEIWDEVIMNFADQASTEPR